MENNFRKVYFTHQLTTVLDDKGKEKKDLGNGILPYGYADSPDFTNENQGYGGIIKTGPSGIMVFDCDDGKVSYEQLCKLYPNIHRHYTVKTRKGYHVYFKNNKEVKNVDNTIYNTKIDFQSGNEFIMMEGTTCERYNGEVCKYTWLYGAILEMPEELIKICTMHNTTQVSDFTSDVIYKYVFDEEQIHEILDAIEINFPEYFTSYKQWFVYTTIMKTIDCKDLWDEYNQQYSGYNKKCNEKHWKNSKANISINFFCKLLGWNSFDFYKVDNNIVEVKHEITDVNSRYIQIPYSDMNKHGTIAVEAKTGTGKSTGTAKICKKYIDKNDEYTVLSIVNLISLAKQQIKTFELKDEDGVMHGLELLYYATNDKKIKFNQSMTMMKNSVICINSLYKLSDCDFSKKIIYIDEIHALTKSLTHNTTLKNQKLVYNTLIRAISECHKLIVSDAHILNNTLLLLKDRLNNETQKIKHYRNSYNKFQDVKCTKFHNENTMYEKLEKAVLSGTNFTFCSDSMGIATDWYNWLYEIASEDVQKKMILYTSETDTELLEDWSNHMIFYSPKISCGVDISIIENTIQYVHITGKSVDSIQLYQMSTRTREMSELNYYSSAKCKVAKYNNLSNCEYKIKEDYIRNKLGLSCIDYGEFRDMTAEDSFYHLLSENEFQKDSLHTNIEYFYRQELSNAGFILIDFDDETEALNDETKDKMEELKEEIKKTKFNKIVDNVEDIDNMDTIGVVSMVKRVELLNLTTSEELKEYKDVIEDEYQCEHFMNYNRLIKPVEYVTSKLSKVVDDKMLSGIHTNVWNKIKYVHCMAEIGGITDLFDFANLKMPEPNKETIKMMTNIKLLYNKRDKTPIESYEQHNFLKLYVFMIDSLTKKIGLIKSTKLKSGKMRDMIMYTIDEDVKTKYDALIVIKNRKNEDKDAMKEDDDE